LVLKVRNKGFLKAFILFILNVYTSKFPFPKEK